MTKKKGKVVTPKPGLDKYAAREKGKEMVAESKKKDKGKVLVRINNKTMILVKNDENIQERKEHFIKKLEAARSGFK